MVLGLSLGCHAQPAGGTLSPELYRRVEILVRERAKVPPNYVIQIGPRTHSEVPGFDQIEVSFKVEGESSKPVSFLLSTDGKTLAQLSKFDLSRDPRTLLTGGDRPSRGGTASAPVQIVGFDDLECPFCARLNAEIFPALLTRYGTQVRIVYRDLPIPQHPWAMRAAIDVNCVAAESVAGYWDLVDQIHAKAGDFGGPEHSLQAANDALDKLATEEAKKQHVNEGAVAACVKKQDDAAVKASMKIGEELDVASTPVLYVNGEKFEGAYPLTDLFRFIDSALVAEGRTPPPPYVAPVAPADAAKAVGKAGN